MKFSAIQKISLIDFPNRIASVLFTPGCNLRCPFCHNWRIAFDPKPPFLNEETALKLLADRKKYVDAVVVTGGEPTMHEELPRFLKRLREGGFAVKLDTNGFFPHVLKECLAHVDYVALDIKTSLSKYAQLGAKDTGALLQSIEMLKTGKTDYELRTTVVPGFADAEDTLRIAELAKGVKTFALQQFVPDDTMDRNFRVVKPYGRERFETFAQTLKNYTSDIVFRL
jgi:pyruvate formate lyase activating enzyme